MGCSSCSTVKNETSKGCKNHGSCSSTGCGSSKLSVFDWLSNMSLPTGEEEYDIYEVSFKNGRKQFFKNIENLKLSMGDVIAVEGSPGHDIGVISLKGELVKTQMKKKKITEDSDEVKKIFRIASQKDIDIWREAQDREIETQRKGREIIVELGLQMKLSDVEYQGDGKKATFYYTADDRVDFRQLIRNLASEFSIRVEMKQVGMRQEAARLGGIGSCGRELCCSTWLTDFRKVNNTAARYQQLALNPLKLVGQCGKLKCCLNYELDTYLDALKGFPRHDVRLKTEKGEASFVKKDIFKKLLWYAYKDEYFKWYKLTLEQVNEIIKLNKSNQLALPLEEYEIENLEEKKITFEDAVGEDSLNRFDLPKKSKRKKSKKNKRVKVNQQNQLTEQQKPVNNQQGGDQQQQHNKSNDKIDNKNQSSNKKYNKRNNRRKPNNNAKNQGDNK